MGVQERKAREKEELRQEILHAARDLFVELGYEAVSMRKIAEKIEYSPTTIYLYFRDKAELLDSLCADMFSRLVGLLSSMAAGESDPVQALRKGLAAYIAFGLEHPAEYRVAFMMPRAHTCDADRPSRSREEGQRALACLRDAVETCARSGVLRITNVDLTTHMLWSAIHGVTSLLITHTEYEWPGREALIPHLLDTLMRGLEPA